MRALSRSASYLRVAPAAMVLFVLALLLLSNVTGAGLPPGAHPSTAGATNPGPQSGAPGAPSAATPYDVTGSVVANVDGYGVPPILVGVNVSASNATCSTTRPLPDTCPLVNWTTTNSSGDFSMNLSAGSYYVSAQPDPSVTGSAYPFGFGGATRGVTTGGGFGVRLVVYPLVPYGNATIDLPAYVCDEQYLSNHLSEGPGCQNPLLSWTQDGAYYLNATNELVFDSFVNHTVYPIANWTPLFQRFPNYAMIPNDLFLTQDGSYVYGWGTLAVGATAITVEAVNTTTHRPFLYTFTNISTTSVAANGQVSLTGWDGNDSEVVLVLASGGVYVHDLWSNTQSRVTALPFFEANNLYWEPYLNAFVDIEANATSTDLVTEWQLSGPTGYSLEETFDDNWGSGLLINGVNGVALNVTNRTLSFELGSSRGVSAVVADFNGSGVLTGFPVVIELPAGSVPEGPAAASDRSSVLTDGPALQGYYDGFYNASWLVRMTPGHVGYETTNLSGAYSYGGSPALYSWSQWSQGGQFYNTSYLIAPNSYECTPEFLDACTINGTGGVPLGTVWWYWQMGLPMYPYPASTAPSDELPPPAPTVTSARATGSTIDLAWTVPTESLVRFYTVEWGTTPSYGQSALLPPGSDTYTIAGLSPAEQYYFSVESWNLHYHEGSTGVNSTATTVPPPTDLVFTDRTSTNISWAWSEPSGTEVANNTLYLFVGGTCGTLQRSVSTDGPATTVETSGLVPGTLYSAEVTAWSPFAQSAPSSCLAVATLPANTTTYSVTFVASGLPRADEWFVNITSGASLATNGSVTELRTDLPNGTYSFEAQTNDSRYRASYSTGFSVNGSALSLPVAFGPVVYPVRFSETGLPGGVLWSVTLGPRLERSNNSTVSFAVTNGSYSYAVSDVSGWHERTLPYRGTITVNGAAVSEPTLVFREVTYELEVLTSGLPSGMLWEVLVGNVSYPSVESSLGLSLPNGTYYLELEASGPFVASPSNGTISIAGGGATWIVAFVAAPTVTPTSPAGTTFLGGSTLLELVVALTVVAVVVGAGVIVLFRRRRAKATRPSSERDAPDGRRGR